MNNSSMVKRGLKLNHFLEKRMFLVVASGLIFGAILHQQFIYLKPLIPYLFAYITLVMALQCSSQDFIKALKKPVLMLLILGLLHIALPVLAAILVRTFLPGHHLLQAGVILGTATPIGVSSVIWVGLANGNIALALTTVIADTLLSPILVPLTLLLTMGKTVSFDIPQLMLGLTWMIVIPTVIGMLIHDRSKGQFNRQWHFINGPTTKIFLALIIATNLAVAWNSLHLLKTEFISITILVFVLSCAGYLLGYGAARLCKLAPADVNAFIFTVGMRNITAGLVMALQYFAELTAIPVVFATLFQQPLAAASHYFLAIKKAPQQLSPPD